jgi:hypothetical protein
MIEAMHQFLRSIAVIISLGALLVGCAGPNDAERQGSPQVQLTNSRGRPLPATTRRVLMLPLHIIQVSGEPQRELDAIFETELNKHLRFEVVRMSRSDLAGLIQREDIGATEKFPAAALEVIRQRYAPDAILFTDITSYRPYRPMAIGVRARLLDARSMSELWAVDSTLDAAHEEVQRAATLGSAEGHAGLVLQSPRAFAGFVAQQVFATLPPR